MIVHAVKQVGFKINTINYIIYECVGFLKLLNGVEIVFNICTKSKEGGENLEMPISFHYLKNTEIN